MEVTLLSTVCTKILCKLFIHNLILNYKMYVFDININLCPPFNTVRLYSRDLPCYLKTFYFEHFVEAEHISQFFQKIYAKKNNK